MIPEETLWKMDVKVLADLYSQPVEEMNAKLLRAPNGQSWQNYVITLPELA